MQEARAGDEAKLRVAGHQADTRTADCVERRRSGGGAVSAQYDERSASRMARPLCDVEQRDREDVSGVVGEGSGRDDSAGERSKADGTA